MRRIIEGWPSGTGLDWTGCPSLGWKIAEDRRRRPGAVILGARRSSRVEYLVAIAVCRSRRRLPSEVVLRTSTEAPFSPVPVHEMPSVSPVDGVMDLCSST